MLSPSISYRSIAIQRIFGSGALKQVTEINCQSRITVLFRPAYLNLNVVELASTKARLRACSAVDEQVYAGAGAWSGRGVCGRHNLPRMAHAGLATAFSGNGDFSVMWFFGHLLALG